MKSPEATALPGPTNEFSHKIVLIHLMINQISWAPITVARSQISTMNGLVRSNISSQFAEVNSCCRFFAPLQSGLTDALPAQLFCEAATIIVPMESRSPMMIRSYPTAFRLRRFLTLSALSEARTSSSMASAGRLMPFFVGL
jgi:hypothetical protein